MGRGEAPRQAPDEPATPTAPEPPAPAPDHEPERTIEEPAAPSDAYANSPAANGLNGGSGDLDLVVERWDNIRMDVKALNRRTEALLQQADPVHVEDSTLTLVAAYPFHQKRLNDDDTRRTIEEVIERQVGKKLSMVCVSREEAQSLRTHTNPAPQSQEPQPPAQPPSDRESSTRRSSTPASQDEDDSDPVPTVSLPPDDDAELQDEVQVSPALSSLELDEERIKAAINIFDAVIVDEDA